MAVTADPIDELERLAQAARLLLDEISSAEAVGWTWADGSAFISVDVPIGYPNSGDLQAAHAEFAEAASALPDLVARLRRIETDVQRLVEAADVALEALRIRTLADVNVDIVGALEPLRHARAALDAQPR